MFLSYKLIQTFISESYPLHEIMYIITREMDQSYWSFLRGSRYMVITNSSLPTLRKDSELPQKVQVDEINPVESWARLTKWQRVRLRSGTYINERPTDNWIIIDLQLPLVGLVHTYFHENQLALVLVFNMFQIQSLSYAHVTAILMLINTSIKEGK